ncbi:carbohydrate-binding protein [Cellulomonas sp.]|uniref:carbohydrate-binding protein n=1 Tax=Cellulomonas sp. TaxID=40001 RepID=UPI0025BC50B4|nr:carbohydrate-binding protein [Cellulomonas sp.]
MPTRTVRPEVFQPHTSVVVDDVPRIRAVGQVRGHAFVTEHLDSSRSALHPWGPRSRATHHRGGRELAHPGWWRAVFRDSLSLGQGGHVATAPHLNVLRGRGRPTPERRARISARVASAGSGGRVEVRLDSASGAVVGTCTMPSSAAGRRGRTSAARPAARPAPRTWCRGSPGAAGTSSTSPAGSSRAAGAAARRPRRPRPPLPHPPVTSGSPTAPAARS